jgi:phage replication O-like protein O
MGKQQGNPQVEDGYTKIANELFQAIYGARFTITQLQIVLCVVRYTYGFNRKTWRLSSSFIASAIGRNQRNIQREINNLIDANVLIYEQASSTSCRKLGINKRYHNWKIETYGCTTVSDTAVAPYKKDNIKDNIKEKEKKEDSFSDSETDEGVSIEDIDKLEWGGKS